MYNHFHIITFYLLSLNENDNVTNKTTKKFQYNKYLKFMGSSFIVLKNLYYWAWDWAVYWVLQSAAKEFWLSRGHVSIIIIVTIRHRLYCLYANTVNVLCEAVEFGISTWKAGFWMWNLHDRPHQERVGIADIFKNHIMVNSSQTPGWSARGEGLRVRWTTIVKSWRNWAHNQKHETREVP